MKNFLLVIALVVGTTQAHALNLEKGRMNYQRHCAACHGMNGMSVMPNVPSLRMNQGLIQPDFAILNKLKMGGPGKPPYIGIMTDEELIDVIAYTRTIR